jgi:1-deoxyxylulose-5-phosphate synthase
MEFRHLGRSGLMVSEISYGNWITHGSQVEEDAALACVRAALDTGITTFDTADVYAGTRAEEVLGKALAGERREGLEVFTKVYWPTGPGRNDRGLSRKHIMESIDGSLRRLRTDYVDLYQLHHFDPATPIDESLRALDDVVRAGKARYVGCSNFHSYQVARALGRSETLGLARFDSVQPRYNLLFRQIERELLPLCREEGLGVIPYNPLAGGFLSGKHRRDTGPTAGTRFTLGNAAERYQDRYWHEREFETVETLRPLAAEAGMSLARLAVAWMLAEPAITSPIVGASRPDQLDDVLPATEKPLDAALKARLDEMTREYRRGDDPR